MRDIADAAALSPANLYHYFRGKDEILFYCQDRALDRMLDSIARARPTPRTGAGSPARRPRLAPRACCSTRSKAPRRICRPTRSRPPLRTRIVRKRDRYEQELRALIVTGVDARRVRRARSGAGRPRDARRAQLDRDLVQSRRTENRRGHRRPHRRPARPRRAELIPTQMAHTDDHIQSSASRCIVNGEPVETLVDDYKTLLEVLREDLQPPGTKHGCELGECGACAVLARRRARALLPDAGGRERRTRGHDRRGPGRRTDACIRCRRNSPIAARRSAAIARRAFWSPPRRCSIANPRRRPNASAKRSPAISAAARAITRSSRRSKPLAIRSIGSVRSIRTTPRSPERSEGAERPETSGWGWGPNRIKEGNHDR